MRPPLLQNTSGWLLLAIKFHGANNKVCCHFWYNYSLWALKKNQPFCKVYLLEFEQVLITSYVAFFFKKNISIITAIKFVLVAIEAFFIWSNLINFPSHHVLVKSLKNSVWNLFKVNIKDSIIGFRSGVFIVNFEQISHIVLVFPLLNLSK